MIVAFLYFERIFDELEKSKIVESDKSSTSNAESFCAMKFAILKQTTYFFYQFSGMFALSVRGGNRSEANSLVTCRS